MVRSLPYISLVDILNFMANSLIVKERFIILIDEDFSKFKTVLVLLKYEGVSNFNYLPSAVSNTPSSDVRSFQGLRVTFYCFGGE